MEKEPLKKLSKFLSYVLRHHPEAIGLELDDYGWAPVDDLIRKSREQGRDITLEKLEAVINSSSRQRFVLSEDRQFIRAGYGHSIPVKLPAEPQAPPSTLYHGTARKNLENIERQGINSGSRNYVHLSASRDDATAVGRRHGDPVVLHIEAGRMHDEGFRFYQSESEENIWLVAEVPSRFIQKK